jgi:CRISPR-associated protein Csh1
MSLAEKLYRIGECISDEELQDLIKEEPIIDDSTFFAFINFYHDGKELRYELIDSKENIKSDEFFFTKAIGGRGKSYYYLYPNLILENFKNIKDEIGKKIVQCINTLENAIEKHYLTDEQQISVINEIIAFLESGAFDDLKNIKSKKVLFAVLLEKQTFFKSFPCILENYLKNPVSDF